MNRGLNVKKHLTEHPESFPSSAVQLLLQYLAEPKDQDRSLWYLDRIARLRVPSFSCLLLSHDEVPQSRDLHVFPVGDATLDDVEEVLDDTRGFPFCTAA